MDIKIMTIVDLSSYDDISKDWFKLLADVIAGSLVEQASDLISGYVAQGGAALGDDIGNSIGGKAGNTIGGIVQGAANAMAMQIADAPILNYYRFRINPSRLGITNNKMQNVHEYGWDQSDIEVWGNRLATYAYAATTGSLVPDPDLLKYGINDIRLSKAWKKFEEFKKFYVLKNKKVLVLFEDEMFEGVFQRFDFARDADLPWRINYNFNLLVDLSTVRNLISGAYTYPSYNTGGWFGGAGGWLAGVKQKSAEKLGTTLGSAPNVLKKLFVHGKR